MILEGEFWQANAPSRVSAPSYGTVPDKRGWRARALNASSGYALPTLRLHGRCSWQRCGKCRRRCSGRTELHCHRIIGLRGIAVARSLRLGLRFVLALVVHAKCRSESEADQRAASREAQRQSLRFCVIIVAVACRTWPHRWQRNRLARWQGERPCRRRASRHRRRRRHRGGGRLGLRHRSRFRHGLARLARRHPRWKLRRGWLRAVAEAARQVALAAPRARRTVLMRALVRWL